MIKSIIAAFRAVFLGAIFFRELRIRKDEAGRYFRKSFNLGLCYGAFVMPMTFRGSLAAGDAAFLSCAYDVATDWRMFDASYQDILDKMLRSLTPASARGLANGLYQSDLAGTLAHDGLERGGIAVNFITRLVGSEEYFAKFGIQRLGLFLQIVDDIIDYETDSASGEQNCLVTPRATYYLELFHSEKRAVLRLFARNRIMVLAINKAAQKAIVIKEAAS